MFRYSFTFDVFHIVHNLALGQVYATKHCNSVAQLTDVHTYSVSVVSVVVAFLFVLCSFACCVCVFACVGSWMYSEFVSFAPELLVSGGNDRQVVLWKHKVRYSVLLVFSSVDG